ncbi:MAG: hypothetical protein GY797_17685 [Deltaproteobacteria bacterium]|nr:hypothetical protein [Deltaproteobacteria bacterium]
MIKMTKVVVKKVADEFCKKVREAGKKRGRCAYGRRYSAFQKRGYKVKLYNSGYDFWEENRGLLVELEKHNAILWEVDVESENNLHHKMNGAKIRSFVFLLEIN